MKKRLLSALSIMALLAFLGYAVIGAAHKQAAFAQEGDWKELAVKNGHQSLSAQSWTIYLWPAGTKGAISAETDVLTFANGRVTSRNLSAQGYPESNYGIFVGEDGSITWETMQARENPKEVDLAFLRGELFKDGSMKGSIIMQPKRGAKKVYAYSTQMPTGAGK